MTKKSPTMQHIRLAVDEKESCSPGANRHFPAHKRPPWITTPGWSRPTRTLGRVLDGRPCDPEERGSEEHHPRAHSSVHGPYQQFEEHHQRGRNPRPNKHFASRARHRPITIAERGEAHHLRGHARNAAVQSRLSGTAALPPPPQPPALVTSVVVAPLFTSLNEQRSSR